MSEPGLVGAPLDRGSAQQPARLRIADLLLITLGTAIAIWILKPTGATSTNAMAALTVAFSPLYGAAVAFVLLAVYRTRRSTGPRVHQPGHWLLLFAGTTFLGAGFYYKGAASAPHQPSLADVVLLAAGVSLLMISFGLIAAMAFGKLEEATDWRRAFQLLFITVVLVWCFFPIVLVLFVAALVAIVRDVLHQTPRDFWHWLGIATFFGIPAHAVLFVVAQSLSR